jgi:hypothetical protein
MFAAGDRSLSSHFNEGNVFPLLHVSVYTQLLKNSQTTEVFYTRSIPCIKESFMKKPTTFASRKISCCAASLL